MLSGGVISVGGVEEGVVVDESPDTSVGGVEDESPMLDGGVEVELSPPMLSGVVVALLSGVVDAVTSGGGKMLSSVEDASGAWVVPSHSVFTFAQPGVGQGSTQLLEPSGTRAKDLLTGMGPPKL